MIGIVVTIGDNDVVEKMNAHDLARPTHPLCQVVVVIARLQVARRVVVTYSHNRSIGKYSLFHHDTNINRNLCDTTM